MNKVENIDELLKDCENLLKNCKQFDNELNARKEGIEFLINEYKTNKKWFREEPGKVTIEDVIKTCFDFGWSSKTQFDHKNNI